VGTVEWSQNTWDARLAAMMDMEFVTGGGIFRKISEIGTAIFISQFKCRACLLHTTFEYKFITFCPFNYFGCPQ